MSHDFFITMNIRKKGETHVVNHYFHTKIETNRYCFVQKVMIHITFFSVVIFYTK